MRNIGFQIYTNSLTPEVLAALEHPPSTIGFVSPDLGTVEPIAQAVEGKRVTLWGRLAESPIELLTEDAANRYADKIIAKSRSLKDIIKVWQAENELNVNGGDPILRIANFDVVFAQRLKEAGLQALGTAFSTGTPYTGQEATDVNMWAHYWPALKHVWLNVHEYWHFARDVPNSVKISEPWHIGRLLNVWGNWPAEHKNDPVMISEIGWEIMPGVQGWHGMVDASDYLANLERYSKKMPPTWAASLFAVAREGTRWASYDIKPLLPELGRMWRDSPAHVWPAEGSKALDVKALDKMLRGRLTAIGVEYDNLIGHFKDQSGAQLDRPRDFAKLHGLAIHHSAGSPTGSTTAIYDVLIDRGLGGFTYHFVIYCVRRSGKIWRKVRLMRDPKDFGAHVKNNNDKWIGAVWPGAYHVNVPDAELMQAQVEVVAILVKALREWTGKQDLSIKAHRDITPPGYTQCPDDGRWFNTPNGFLALFEKAMAGGQPPPTEDEYQRGYQEGQHHERMRAVGIFERMYSELVGADQQATEIALDAIDRALGDTSYLPQAHKDRDLT